MINTNTKVGILEGAYKRQKNQLSGEGTKLLISTRKKPTKKKPALFMLIKVKDGYNYVSSLYPTTSENEFELEYQGINYVLCLEDATAKISRA